MQPTNRPNMSKPSTSHYVDSQASRSHSANLIPELSVLSDDDFFQRLTAVREEHTKTLKHYEQLYHEKLMADHGGDIGLIFGQSLFSRQSADGASKERSPTTSAGLCVNGVGLSARAQSPCVNDVGLGLSTRAHSPCVNGVGLSARAQSPSVLRSPVSILHSPSPIPLDMVDDGIDLVDNDVSVLTAAPGPMGRDYLLSLHEPVNTGGDTFNHNMELIRRSADKPPRSPCPIHKCKEAWSDDDIKQANGYHRTLSDSSAGEVDYDESKYERQDEAMTRIGQMWDDFTLADYSSRTSARTTQRSATTDRRHRPQSAGSRPRKYNEADSWRHRITMPQPFRMTIRDETQESTKSRTMLEYEHQKAMQAMHERFECEKKFRAQAVPAHVYMPLFDELMEKGETRRRTNVQIAADMLKSQEKPFHFAEREKKIPDHGRRHSAPQVKHKQFKARPIPKSHDDMTEKLLEEEEYRKIRIRMRSKELLRSASLPPRMASLEQCKYTVGKLKEKLKEEKRRSEKDIDTKQRPKFQPRIKKRVPDFDTIHKKQQKEATNRYRGKEPKMATVCEPFKLRASSIPSNIDKVLADIDKDESQLRENRWPFKTLRAKPKLGEVRRSYDSLPSCTTKGSQLRQSINYDQLKQKSAKEMQDEKNRKQQEELVRRRRKELFDKAAANDQSKSLRASNQEKLKVYREEDRRRIDDYKLELAAMQARVGEQPFLFERTSQINARKRAEKKFEDALRNAGVDEESISQAYKSGSSYRSGSHTGPATDRDPSLNLSDDDISEKLDSERREYRHKDGLTDEEPDTEEPHYTHSFVDDDDDDDDMVEDSLNEREARIIVS